MNILVSGWPGVGQTTLSLLLAKNFNFTHLQGSNTFRYIWKGLGLDKTAEDRVKADELVQNYWGKIYEKYVDYALVNDDKFVLESDIAGFRDTDKRKIFSIFLIANNEVRDKRLISDKRGDEIKTLIERDLMLKREYKELFNADFFDLDKIKINYSFLLDSSELNISLELEIVYTNMFKQGFLDRNHFTNLMNDIDNEQSNYEKNGKAWYVNYLTENKLIPGAEEIIKKIRSAFKDEINNLPNEIKKIIYDIA